MKKVLFAGMASLCLAVGAVFCVNSANSDKTTESLTILNVDAVAQAESTDYGRPLKARPIGGGMEEYCCGSKTGGDCAASQLCPDVK